MVLSREHGLESGPGDPTHLRDDLCITQGCDMELCGVRCACVRCACVRV